MLKSITPHESKASIYNKPHAGDDKIASPTAAEASPLLRLCRRLVAALWRQLCLHIESAYIHDPRELSPVNPLRPTSLGGKQIADIWLLNSKH